MKAKRLLLPSLLFSIIYYAIFCDITRPMLEIIYSILNGCGHLWFLPMLFLCFVAAYAVCKLHISNSWVLISALICSLYSFLPLPFRLNNAMYYFLFFYIGYLCFDNMRRISRYMNSRYVILSICLFLCLFILLTSVVIFFAGGCNGLTSNELVNKILRLSITNAFRLLYSISGVIMLFLTINYLLKTGLLKMTSSMWKISTLCFGVYVYQQFILKYLYYYTGFWSWYYPSFLPWGAFIVALNVSLLLSWLTLKTKLGKMLIG